MYPYIHNYKVGKSTLFYNSANVNYTSSSACNLPSIPTRMRPSRVSDRVSPAQAELSTQKR